MGRGPLIFCLITIALLGCEKASEPVDKVDRQAERKDLQSGSPSMLMWSPEFRDQTLKECIQSATADGSAQGVRKCKCVVEKASTTMPEQKFRSIQTDPAVKDLLKQIGAAC